jgi:hypothetical protein
MLKKRKASASAQYLQEEEDVFIVEKVLASKRERVSGP